MGNQRPIPFGRHGHCSSEDIMVLICYIISQDHVIKESCEFMSEYLRVSHHPGLF